MHIDTTALTALDPGVNVLLQMKLSIGSAALCERELSIKILPSYIGVGALGRRF